MPPIINPHQKFAMPMYRDWVPERVRPWIYVVFLVLFQLTGCIYLGSAAHVAGATGLMHDDIMFIGIVNVIGVNMPFPLLFRFKFRFTNRQLLLNAALVILACNLLALLLTNNQWPMVNGQWRLPVLCVLSFLAGFFKLCGTFECASNIQLWMAPGRDFKIFFPLLYIMVVGDIFLQSWLAGIITYHYSWQAVNWFMAGLMAVVALGVWVLTRNWRMMKPVPMLSIDWLGCLLWSLLFTEVVWLFNYGEYYNWWQGRMFRTGVVMTVVTLLMTVARASRIRHPYIALSVFTTRGVLPMLALYLVAEWLNTTPKVLQGAFTSGVLHWGWTQTNHLELVGWAGNLAGCLFTLWWMKGLRFKYTQLLAIGGLGLVYYQVMMYFYISPALNIERLYLPLFARAFGYAIYFTALTIHLEELLEFMPFFMGLTLSGIMRNGPCESLMSGTYGHGLRQQVADALSRPLPIDPTNALMVAIKQLFGVTSLLGVAFLILLLLYDVQPVRSTMKKMPSLKRLGRMVLRQAKRQQ